MVKKTLAQSDDGIRVFNDVHSRPDAAVFKAVLKVRIQDVGLVHQQLGPRVVQQVAGDLIALIFKVLGRLAV